MPQSGRKLITRQVEKGTALAVRKIVGRLDDDLDRRFACIHLDCQFRVPKIDLVAPSIGAPENSVCHVANCNRNLRCGLPVEELRYSVPSPSSKKHPGIEF